MKKELIALADRVDALTGPCRETDFWISVRVNGTEYADAELQSDIDLVGIEGMVIDAPYTASVDAAMTLIPEGYDWAVFHTNSGLTVHAWCGSRDDVFANTPALALTAAALRARAEREYP